jgi:exopolyphosphatase / guanosine-5'-triphosphate,3'-diphosphate pyrophosphatase
VPGSQAQTARAPTGSPARLPAVRAGIVDVGSNTVRLLVAAGDGRGAPVGVREEKAYVRLGAEIVRHGAIRAEKLEEAVSVARRYARIARKLGADPVEVIVTAPGRQAENGDELAHALAQATRTPVRVLSADEEGALAYLGAVLAAGDLHGTVAVCDVGGGSTEIAVGVPPEPPTWVRSVDLGALRLAEACFENDPPRPEEVAEAVKRATAAFSKLVPPAPQRALAVGGSARALAKIVGRTLGDEELRAAVVLTSQHRAAKLARSFGLDVDRARVLAAGAILLGEISWRLGIPLELARGGLREGAAAQLIWSTAAADVAVG